MWTGGPQARRNTEGHEGVQLQSAPLTHPSAPNHATLPNKRPPQGAPHRARGSALSVALNKSIMSASCVGDLLGLVMARGHSFDFFK